MRWLKRALSAERVRIFEPGRISLRHYGGPVLGHHRESTIQLGRWEDNSPRLTCSLLKNELELGHRHFETTLIGFFFFQDSLLVGAILSVNTSLSIIKCECIYLLYWICILILSNRHPWETSRKSKRGIRGQKLLYLSFEYKWCWNSSFSLSLSLSKSRVSSTRLHCLLGLARKAHISIEMTLHLVEWSVGYESWLRSYVRYFPRERKGM